MELKRIFRGPLLLVLLAVLVITITLGWANSGSSYQQVDTAKIVQLIQQGQVKSAVLTDKNQTIQVTTKSGQQYEADFIAGQGLQLQQDLQTEFDKGSAGGYDVQIPKSRRRPSRDVRPYLSSRCSSSSCSADARRRSRAMNFGKSKAGLIPRTRRRPPSSPWPGPRGHRGTA
jgi:cell division protease FtsH